MPRNNSPEARERRRLAAEARAGAGAVATKVAMSADELRAFNANMAMEKATHAEGGGHRKVIPEEERAESLIALRHIPRLIKVRGEWVPNPDQRTCPLRGLGCLECEASDLEQLALNRQIFKAQAGLRIKMDQEAKRRGDPIRKKNKHTRPDVGYS